jgi:23S rRNA pseudouridine1911/1915/1917 synthase
MGGRVTASTPDRAAGAKLSVLLEDNHLLVINKPPGLLTQPAAGDQDSVETRAKEWIRRTKQKPGTVFLHTVHRLDRDVSGAVLLARTSKALTRLNETIRARKITKTYHALVESLPEEETARLEHWIVHESHRARVAKKTTPEAKLAVLEYRVVSHVYELFLLEVTLETGRYHQIRAQLAAIGCPIAGDARYGSRYPAKGRIALHHRRLVFAHPVRDEAVEVDAPYPIDWPGVSVRS